MYFISVTKSKRKQKSNIRERQKFKLCAHQNKTTLHSRAFKEISPKYFYFCVYILFSLFFSLSLSLSRRVMNNSSLTLSRSTPQQEREREHKNDVNKLQAAHCFTPV